LNPTIVGFGAACLINSGMSTGKKSPSNRGPNNIGFGSGRVGPWKKFAKFAKMQMKFFEFFKFFF
jgi:hypothetical protein